LLLLLNCGTASWQAHQHQSSVPHAHLHARSLSKQCQVVQLSSSSSYIPDWQWSL